MAPRIAFAVAPSALIGAPIAFIAAPARRSDLADIDTPARGLSFRLPSPGPQRVARHAKERLPW